MTDEPYNAADPEQVKAARSGDKDKVRLRREGLAALMSTPQGRAFMWHILEECRTYQASYIGAEAPMQVAFYEGKRSIGSMLTMLILERNESTYGQMIAENR